MKIKLMIFSLIVVAGLQGSQPEQTFVGAIYKALEKNEKYQPVVFYDTCKYSDADIKTTLEDPDMKFFLQNDVNQIADSIIISDTDYSDNRREIMEIKFGKRCNYSSDSMVMVGGMKYEKNQLIKITDGHGGFDFKTKNKSINASRSFVIFNMYRCGYDELTIERYKAEINEVIGEIPAVVIVGPEYDGPNIENFCRSKNVSAIVFDKNKPKEEKVVWWRKHWIKLVSVFSLGLVGGLICYFKFVR